VTADGGSFNSGTLAGGGSFSHRFTTAGTFAYHCAIHASMTGTVVVSG
jgi:plastocyanin